MSIMAIIDKPKNAVDNYKTYIIAVAAGILGILEVSGVFVMPTGGWFVLSAVGLGAIRHTLQKLQMS